MGSGSAFGGRAVHSGDAAAHSQAPPPPSAPPPPPPTPTPPPAVNEVFVAGDYIIDPRIYNEFSPGNTGNSSYAIRGAGEFVLANIPFMLAGTYERWQLPAQLHDDHERGHHHRVRCRLLRNDHGWCQQLSPVMTTTPLNDQLAEVKLAVRVLQPRIYIGVGYMWVSRQLWLPEHELVGLWR